MKHLSLPWRRVALPIFSLLLLMLSGVFTPVTAQNWQWAVKGGGSGTDQANKTAIDAAGNAYVVGLFQATATFGSTTLTSAGGSDIFVAKLNSAGVYQWAVRAGGSGDEQGNDIGINGSGNVYVTGSFSGTVAFGASSLTSTGNDVFVAQLNATSGNWSWAVRGGDNGTTVGKGLALDGVGNVYVTGSFSGTATFGTTTLSSSGFTDVFAAKIDNNGTWQWAVRAGGVSSDWGNGIAVDGNGNVYLTGAFAGTTATFGNTTLTSTGSYDVFVAKLSAAGVWQWAVRAGGSNDDQGNGIAVDGSGNAYLTGYFWSTNITFGSTTLTNSGTADVFVAKLSTAGVWQWAVRAGGSGDDRGTGIAVDGNGNAYLTGAFGSTTANFGNTTLTNAGSYDVFAARLSAAGVWQWAVRAGGSSHDEGTGIAVDGSGNAYLTGYFQSAPATFGSTTLTNSGGSDAFITRLTLAGPVAITTFTPTSGPIGTVVTLTGTNLTGATAVRFNGTASTSFTVASATSITATVPPGTTTGTISVTTPGGTATSASSFTVTAPIPPTITSFTPTSGAPGALVTITGTGFTGASTVRFGTGVCPAGTFTVVSSTSLTATVPPLATTGKLSVTTPGGTATSAGTFTVAPIISSFTPASGSPGSVVILTGLNFTSTTSVRLNGVAATTTYNSATQLTAVVPAAATSGFLTATNTTGTGTSATAFTVTATPAPTISSFTPTSGVLGTVVTITGTNFTGATAVRFNATRTTAITVLSSTQVRAAVPVAATTGKLYVITPSGMAQSAASFTVVAPPTVTVFSPTSGSPGAVVLLTGTNLTGATSVTFNGEPAASYTVNSATQIAAVVPAGAATGRLTVTTVAGTALSNTDFSITTAPAPTISSFTPASGLRGATVVLTGTNFTGVSSVKLGTIAVTAYTVNSATQLTLTVPATAVTGKFFVTAAGGMAQSAASYTVLLLPTISSFTPTSGPAGTLVTINGTNFAGISGVAFGGVAATSYTVVSTAKITATVPTGAVTGAITVTNQAGIATKSTFTYTGPRPSPWTATAAEMVVPVDMYPNPAHDVVRISGATCATVTLFDALGRQVATAAVTDGTATLDVRGMHEGVYTVRAGNVTRRLVVTKD